MADLAVRNTNGGQPQTFTPREFDPIRMVRDLLRWDPFQQMAPLWPEGRALAFSPAFEVKETKNAYLFKADLPGMKEQDVDVSCTGSRLTISGKREEDKEERGDTYYSCECSYGSFSRSFALPDGADVDQIHADLKAGVLTVAVPKKPEVQAKKITVKAAEKSIKA